MGGRSCYWWIVDGAFEDPPRTRVMLDLHERGKALVEVRCWNSIRSDMRRRMAASWILSLIQTMRDEMRHLL